MAMVALGLFGNGDKVSPANEPRLQAVKQSLPTVVEWLLSSIFSPTSFRAIKGFF